MNDCSYDSFKGRRLFSGLDGLRFLSITAVVWHHAPIQPVPFRAGSYGFLGVDLFFVISGFLIVTLLLREREKTETISLRSFYARRVLRLFPVYYGLILGLGALYYFVQRDSEFGKQFVGDLPIYLLHLGNIIPVGYGIVWSLATEEQFYLVWPFLEKYFKRYLLVIVVVLLIVNQGFNFFRGDITAWLGFPGLRDRSVLEVTFTPILLGVMLAHLLNARRAYEGLRHVLARACTVPVCLLAMVALCTFGPSDISGFPRLALHVFMTLLVGAVVVNERNPVMALLTNRLVSRIGVVSYGIYLFHIYCLVVAEKVLAKLGMTHGLAVFFLGYAVTYLVAELSYRFYETPFLRLKRRLSVIHQTHA